MTGTSRSRSGQWVEEWILVRVGRKAGFLERRVTPGRNSARNSLIGLKSF